MAPFDYTQGWSGSPVNFEPETIEQTGFLSRAASTGSATRLKIEDVHATLDFSGMRKYICSKLSKSKKLIKQE